MGTSGQQIERLEKGQRKLSQDWIDKAAGAFGVPSTAIISEALPHGLTDTPSARGSRDDSESARLAMVGIRYSDADFGLGAVFTDDAPQVELLQFPRAWVESITYTSPAMLSWVRARGSSMKPTINDGDMILLDHSQRKVEDQDEIWAFTVGDTRAIKRLRVKGDRYQILSDNPSVPPDEEPIDFVNIVGRVIFVGSRT